MYLKPLNFCYTNSIWRDKTATDSEGNGNTLMTDSHRPSTWSSPSSETNLCCLLYKQQYTRCSQLQRLQDLAERPMWLDSRSSGRGDKEELADVLGWEGTKVTIMMPITEREDGERLGPPTPTSDTWKCFRWQLDCVCLPETLWENLGKVHFQNRHLVSVTSGNTCVEPQTLRGTKQNSWLPNPVVLNLCVATLANLYHQKYLYYDS